MNTLLAKGSRILKVLALAACAALGFAASADAQGPTPPHPFPQAAPFPQSAMAPAPWPNPYPNPNGNYLAQPIPAQWGMAPGYGPEGFAATPYPVVPVMSVDANYANWNQDTVNAQPAPATGEASAPRKSRSRIRRSSSDSVACTPAMMGDFLGGGIPFAVESGGDSLAGYLPLGLRRIKVAEGNKAVAMDRIYFNYNYYDDALQFIDASEAGAALESLNVHQYTLGIEKSFLDGRGSVEIRVPVTSELAVTGSYSGIDLGEGRMGNVAIIPKITLFETCRASLAGGFGITLPTAADVVMTHPTFAVLIRNEAVHLSPFLALTAVSDGRMFYNLFTQVDLPAMKNPVLDGFSDDLSEASMLFVDASVGYWLYRDSSRAYFTSMAAIFEFHTSLVMEEGDTYELGAPMNVPDPVGDLYTATLGLHVDITELTKFRIGYAVPLHGDHDGYFDDEFMIQLQRYF